MRTELLLVGAGAIALGLFPTPDDVTIISPVVQITGGGLLVALGLLLPDKK